MQMKLDELRKNIKTYIFSLMELLQQFRQIILQAPMEQVSPEFDLLNIWRLGMTSVAKKMKPLISTNANSGVKIGTEIPALSDADILKAYNEAKQYHLNRINSPEWEQAVIRSEIQS